MRGLLEGLQRAFAWGGYGCLGMAAYCALWAYKGPCWASIAWPNASEREAASVYLILYMLRMLPVAGLAA